jgi:hypothetical protein
MFKLHCMLRIAVMVYQFLDCVAGVLVFCPLQDFQMYLNFCAIGLMNAQLFDHSFSLSRRLQVRLLGLGRVHAGMPKGSWEVGQK